jgi:lactoylglutathione lyase
MAYTLFKTNLKGVGRMYEVAHVGLVVKNAECSSDFYCDVLGCKRVDSYRDERIKILMLQAGTQIIELVQYLAGDKLDRQAGVVDHIAFKVEDIEAAVDKLRSAGVKLLFEAPLTMAGGKRIFFFAGPDGERLEFIQEAAQ